MTLILFGFKSCGKTRLGMQVAKQLCFDFLDLDHLLVELYLKESGERLTIRQVYQKLGENAFRSLETRALFSLPPLKNTILAVGGGTVLNAQNVEKLQSMGRLIYLEADKETLRKQIFKAEIPAFFGPQDPHGSFELLYAKRKPIYEQIDALRLPLTDKTEQQIIHELCSLTRKYYGK